MGMQPTILQQSLGYVQFGAGKFSSGATLASVTPSAGFKTTAGIPDGTTQIVVYDETATMRWTDDGLTTPTTTLGNPVTAGQALVFTSNFPNLQFCGASAVINVTYYRSA